MTAKETVLWGAYIDYHALTSGLNYASGGTIAGSALAQFEANCGKQCSLVHISGTPGKWGDGAGGTTAFSVLSAKADLLIAAGRMAYFEWAPWDWALPASNYSFRPSEIAAGTWDAYITQFATDCKAWGKPILFRMMHEMNDTSGGFPWSFGNTGTRTISGGTATSWGHAAGWTVTNQDHIDAWKRIVNIFRYTVGCTNALFHWCPNRWAPSQITPSHGNGGTGIGMWPGNDAMGRPYVDWMGVDSYPSQPSETLGNALNGTGTLNFLSPMYTELCALDPTIPILVGETAFYGASGSVLAVTSITTNGTSWTVTMPSGTWLATNSISITGASPAGYNGQWTIASAAGAVLTITNTAAPGAFVSASGQLIDRITRAASITQSLEVDLPALPRIKALVLYHVAGQGQIYEFDGNGSVSGNSNGTGATLLTATVDALAFRAAIGNGHFLAGNTMGLNLAARTFIPYQDQPEVSTFERYVAVRKSITGLVGLWLNNDASGPAVDSSGNARNGTLNGTASLAATNVIPAQPTWTSLLFPGAAGSNITVASAADFSPTTTNKLTVEFSIVFPSITPALFQTQISKNSGNPNSEWDFGQNTTGTLQLNLRNLADTLASSAATSAVPAAGVPHHIVFTIDLTATLPLNVYVDGAAPAGSNSLTGVVTAGTAGVIFGQKTDVNPNPLAATTRMGPVAIWNTCATAETAADLYASWVVSPVASAFGSSPSSNTAAVNWTNDIAGSSAVDYGLTGAWGSVTTLNSLRSSGAKSVTISGLAPVTLYHWRSRTANVAGTLGLSADQTFTTSAGAGAIGARRTDARRRRWRRNQG